MTIEAQLDTIAQHLSEIKRLLSPAAPDMGYAAPATKPHEEADTTPEPEVASGTDIAPEDYRNVTLDDCIAMATQIVKSADDGSGVVKLKEILRKMGTEKVPLEKVSLLKPSQFAAFMRAAKGV